MSDYITDPELLKQLNAEEKPADEYVNDPKLLQQLNQGIPSGAQQMFQAPPNPVDYTAPQALSMAAGAVAPALGMNAVQGATANIRDAAKVGNMLSQMPMGEFMQRPVGNTAKLAGAYLAGHPYLTAAGNVAKGAVGGLFAPESAVLMPYQMAAYEQDKIRQNPYAPGLEYNPFAQVQRGEAPTTRAAGAMNQRRAVANQRYGGLTPQEQAILDKDRLNMAVRMQAAKRILGQ